MRPHASPKTSPYNKPKPIVTPDLPCQTNGRFAGSVPNSWCDAPVVKKHFGHGLVPRRDGQVERGIAILIWCVGVDSSIVENKEYGGVETSAGSTMKDSLLLLVYLGRVDSRIGK